MQTTIIVWALPAHIVQQLADTTRRHASLLIVRSAEEVREALASTLARAQATCLMVQVPADAHGPFWVDLRELRAHHPSVPVIAVAVGGISSYMSAMRIGQFAISELLTADPDLHTEQVDGALARAYNDSIISRIWRSAALTLPDAYVTILKRALRMAHEPLTTAKLASATQMHERTLRKYCTRHRLPPPQQIVGWARLLLVAFYLDEGGRSTRHVADLLGFPTTDALRKQLMRYTRRSATQLRDGHAVHAVARLMERELVAHGMAYDMAHGANDGS